MWLAAWSLAAYFLCPLLAQVWAAESLLDFRTEYTRQELDLLCQVTDSSQLNHTDIGRLVISKDDANGSQALAWISIHSTEPVFNLSVARVSGRVSYDSTSRQYLRILWKENPTIMSGNYSCLMFGVNEDLMASQNLSIQLEPRGLIFEASPPVIAIGLTKVLELRCSLLALDSLNISRVGSFEIFKSTNGTEILLARTRIGNNKLITSAVKGVEVVEAIESDNPYIGLRWTNPTENIAGNYSCICFGVKDTGEPIVLDNRAVIGFDLSDEQALLERFQEVSKYLKEMADVEKREQQLRELQQQETTTAVRFTPRVKSLCRHPVSCDDIYFSLPVGQHVVIVEPEDGLGPMTVLCEVKSKRDIYTVFQKRFDGSVNFYRRFAEYEDGFGWVDGGEFWLGLRNIRRLLQQNGDKNLLRVDLAVLGVGVNYTRIYPIFRLGPEPEYRLQVSGLYDRGLGMSSNSNQQFSTHDQGLRHVASSHNRGAGWWFPPDQGYVNLNGVWGVAGKPYSIFWWELRQDLTFILEKTEMKFKRSS